MAEPPAHPQHPHHQQQQQHQPQQLHHQQHPLHPHQQLDSNHPQAPPPPPPPPPLPPAPTAAAVPQQQQEAQEMQQQQQGASAPRSRGKIFGERDQQPQPPPPPPAQQQPPPPEAGSAYRPLNVRDALTYLDQVKVQFHDQPDVYNRFLDVMKEFKGQIIDTPGVIDRVSSLFRGHPFLIQGFNTFLPPGYRIECQGAEGDERGLITVITPNGTISHIAGQFSAGLAAVSASNAAAEQGQDVKGPAGGHDESAAATSQQQQAASSHPSVAVVDPQSAAGAGGATADARGGRQQPQIEFNHAIAYVNKIKNRFHSDPDKYKQFLEILQTYQKDHKPIREVYAAVTMLFQSAPDLLDEFSQFLPDTSAGGAAPSTGLFAAFGQIGLNSAAAGGSAVGGAGSGSGAGVPEASVASGSGAATAVGKGQQGGQQAAADKAGAARAAGGGAGGAAAAGGAAGAQNYPPSKKEKQELKAQREVEKKKRQAAKDVKETAAGTKAKKSKHHHKAEASPPVEEYPAAPVQHFPSFSSAHNAGGSLASPDEIAFFERVKKFIEDKNTYHEFLKLLNLFVQDIIDSKVLVERAALFIGESGEIWNQFRVLVGDDQAGRGGIRGVGGQYGLNGSGGILGAGAGLDGVLDNNPAADRPRVDLNSCKAFGASYRKLPKSEVNLSCSGRDPMCWDVLNDEWVSHPTSLSEDAPPFVAHKKNMYEDALHRAEEERHEYDYHIEANLRTIALLEPIASRIQTMSPEEKQGFRLKPGLGGQSKSIYQRIIKKIYGKDAGLEVIGALHDNPTVAVPVVLARLKLKDEEWKKAQREWNKVWREVDAKNFYKSLDHQGVSFKANDKKAITTKSLISEIEALRREQVQRREALLDPTLSFRNKFQYSYTIEDTAVLQDCLKLVFSYLDRAPGGLSTRDREGVEAFLREFVPTFFLFDRDEFDLAFEIPNLSGGSGDGESDVDGMSDAASGMGEEEDDNSSASARKLKKAAGDLRKKLLKGAVTPSANGRGRDSPSATPGPSSVPAVAAVAPAVTPVADDAMAVDTPEPEAAAAATGGAAPATPAATEATETSASSTEVTTTAEQLAAASTEGIVSTTIAEGAVAGTALTPVSSAAAAEDPNGMAVDPSPKAASSTDPTVPGTAPVGPSSSSSTAAPVANDGGASTWIAMQESVASPADPNGVAASRSASVAAAEAATHGETKDAKPAAPRKINMFANSPIYCLFRLLQMLYNRLESLKLIGKQLSAQKAQLINPLAVELGLNDVGGPSPLLTEGVNPSTHFYEHLLDLCEKLFDNEIDQAFFEETMRHMFGTQAFVSFTLDKLVAVIVKQVLVVSSDSKSQELVRLLEADRERTTTDARQQIHYRQTAEMVTGADENLYRIEWVEKSKSLLIQLLGTDDLTVDEGITSEEKWKTYLESFILSHPTEGLPSRVAHPFLKRTKQPLPPAPSPGSFIAESGLEVKVCIGSYKLLYVENTEDFYKRRVTRAEEEKRAEEVARRRKESKEKLERWLESKTGGGAGVGSEAISNNSGSSTAPATAAPVIANGETTAKIEAGGA